MRSQQVIPVALLAALAGSLVPTSPIQAQAPSGLARASELPPRAVRRDLPLTPSIRRAYAAGTRDPSGKPGPRYWQQRVDYRIDATLDAPSAILHGTETITLHNTSPDTLKQVVLRLYQNYFRAETERNDYVTDITDGITIERLSVNGG